jgi:hypothetical protein
MEAAVRLAAITCCAALAAALTAPLHAETVAVTQLVSVRANGSVNVRLMCPEEFEILAEAQAYTARRPTGIERNETYFVGRQGNLLPLEDAAGQETRVRNTLATDTDVSLTMLCARRESPPVIATANLGPVGSTVLYAQCPDGKAPVGAAANLDETALRTNYKLFKYGNKYLDQLPDGNAAGAPTEIELFAANALQHVQSLRMAARCVDAANLETIVQSVATAPGSAFTMFVPIPDGYDFVGMTSAAGTNSALTLTHVWLADGSVSTLPPHADHVGRVKGVFVDGVDTRTGPAKYSERAYVGVVVRRLGSAQPQPAMVEVVEFHHAALDHYFITANAKEIADLDSGVHQGWARTGKSFKAYAVGSSGNTGRRPVCRAYGNPAAGLDSHFYSASPQECVATVTKFDGAWLLEASEVFEMELPHTSTGECASGGVPIYRVWNNRADSNHRYTTSIADRDAMVAKGYVKEGYGPQSVTLCALP